jgi:CRP-like cAMP-binding protein
LQRLLQSNDALWARWRLLRRRSYRPGDALLRVGDPAATAWLIEQGLLRIYFLGEQGRERNRSFHAEGAWVAASVAPQVVPSPYTIEALEPTAAVELPYAELGQLQQEFPSLFGVVMEAVAWTFSRQAAREAELLLHDGEQRYLGFLAQYPELAARVPLHQIASYLGITNVALSRIRRRLGLADARRRSTR